MKSSSLRLLSEAGISDHRNYRDEVIHEWYLSPIYRERLLVFLLAQTDMRQLDRRLKDGEVIIQQKAYSVVWINSPKACREAQALLVSLRYCPYLERGYALIKVRKGETDYPELEY